MLLIELNLTDVTLVGFCRGCVGELNDADADAAVEKDLANIATIGFLHRRLRKN